MLTARRFRPTAGSALIAALLALATGRAEAHPHVFIDAMADVVFDDQGRLVGVRHVWRFDEGYSAFASQGLDADGDGTLSVEELKPLAEVNVDSMKDYDYFTFITAGDRDIALARPSEYWLQSDGGLLTLYFTVPTESPVEIRGLPAQVDVFDPTYYVAFEFVEGDAVSLENAPAGCALKVTRPPDMDAATAELLAGIGPDQRELPPELQVLTVDQVNGVALSCP
jgi:ABC-type uncharacterized transport system substrate-binding protein